MFKQKAQKWLNQERDRSKFALPDSSLISELVGFTVNSAEDVIRQKQRAFSFVDEVRRSVIDEIQSKPESLSSLMISNINKDDLDEIIDDINEKSTELLSLMVAQPTFSAEKSTTNQVIEDFQRLFRVRPSTSEPLDIVDDFQERGLLDASIVEEYFQNNPTARNPNQNIVLSEVNEVRDRYYTINSVPNDFNFPEDSEIRIVDQDGVVIEDFFGAEDITLTPDGSLIVEGEVYQVENASIQTRLPVNPSTRISFLKTSPDLIKDEYAFEIWACYIFDLTDYIIARIVEIQTLLDSWKDTASRLLSFVNNASIGFAVDLQGEALRSIINVKSQEILQNIIGDELLGISATLGSNSFRSPGNVSVCDINKGRYCEISSSIQTFLDDLNIDIGSLDIASDFDFSVNESISLDLQDYIDSIQNLLDQINLSKLKSAVCSFVDKKIRARPVELTNIQQTMLLMSAVAFPTLPSLLNSEKLLQISESLKRAGYDALSDILNSGNISLFLTAEEWSYPGMVAECLERYADITESPRRARELARLARLARTKDDRITVGRRVRDGMRLRLSKNNDVENAELVSVSGQSLINEVINE